MLAMRREGSAHLTEDSHINVPVQPRRLIMAPAAVGCKRLAGDSERKIGTCPKPPMMSWLTPCDWNPIRAPTSPPNSSPVWMDRPIGTPKLHGTPKLSGVLPRSKRAPFDLSRGPT